MRVFDYVMTIANVAVMAVAAGLLMRFTSMPHGACFVIGMPAGLAVFWLVLLSIRSSRHIPDHAKVVGRAIRSRPEFSRIAVVGYPDGKIVVAGPVASPSDLEDLRQLVEGTRPQVTVSYSVFVRKR
jgi:hypothetical protein